MDRSTIRLIRHRVLKDIENWIPDGFYITHDTSDENIAGIDLAMGIQIYTRGVDEQPILSPRQKAAGRILMLIGLSRLGCKSAYSDSSASESLDAELVKFRSAVESYLLHLDPSEAIPIETAIRGKLKNVTNVQPTRAVPKQLAQERRLLELLNESGYIPGKLPNHVIGTSGVKAKIRTLAIKERTLFTKNSFDKAWQRLRSDGQIADGG